MHPDDHAKLLLLGWQYLPHYDSAPQNPEAVSFRRAYPWHRPHDWPSRTMQSYRYPEMTDQEAAYELRAYQAKDAEYQEWRSNLK